MRWKSLRCRCVALSASMLSIAQRSRGMVIRKMRQQRRIHYWNESTHIHILFPYRRQIRVSIVHAHTQSERPERTRAGERARREREMKNPPEQWIEKRAHVFFARNIYMSGWIHNFGLKSGNTFQCTTMAGVPPPQPPACLLLEVGVGRVRPRFPTHAHRASVSILLRRRLIDFYIFSGLLYARYTARHAKWIAVYGFC